MVGLLFFVLFCHLQSLESQWKELGTILEEKQRLGKARSEQLQSFERLRDQVLDWLNSMELRVQRLQPVAVDIEILRNQTEELKVYSASFFVIRAKEFLYVTFLTEIYCLLNNSATT